MHQAQERLRQLIEKLALAKSVKEKSALFDESIQGIDALSDHQAYLLKALCAIGQRSVLKQYLATEEKLNLLLEKLEQLDRFYHDFGGLVGYQQQVLNLLGSGSSEPVDVKAPTPVELDKEQGLAIAGLEKLNEMAEVYAIGGAADRLNLIDEESGIALPAAKLKLMGHTLLAHMVRDLFAREYLHYRLFGKQVSVPLAMMTSAEKNNDTHVKQICEENGWFGRNQDDFIFFCQPLVPTFNKAGEWSRVKENELLLKPGGHGVIWKLAIQEKVFEQLKERGKRKAVVRQINNPVAGLDTLISAFSGYGLKMDKQFGFASCPQRKNAKEGVNVLKKTQRGWSLSNIEYCDLRADEVSSSEFPANTNLLFVDLEGIEKAVKEHPYPGVLLNFKQASNSNEEVARLELTMQNIADYFSDKESYLTLSERKKTISAAKRAYVEGKPLLETPEGVMLDVLRNHHDLMSQCGVEMPSLEDLELRLFDQLPFYITYHPSLGPFYSVIAQKIEGGKLSEGAEMRLEIADLKMKNVSVEGSLAIEGDAVMGHQEDGKVVFSNRTSKVTLENVEIVNKGVAWEKDLDVVGGHLSYHQRCFISLGENSEFIAKDVTFRGDFIIRVPQNTRCVATQANRKVEFSFEPVEDAQAMYQHRLSHNRITLQ